jgi:hypothetical protein
MSDRPVEDDRIFRAKIAVYQSNVQVYLSLTIALFAGIIGLGAIEYQIIGMGLSHLTNDWFIIPFSVCLILSFTLAYYTWVGVGKLKSARQELSKLMQ